MSESGFFESEKKREREREGMTFKSRGEKVRNIMKVCE